MKKMWPLGWCLWTYFGHTLEYVGHTLEYLWSAFGCLWMTLDNIWRQLSRKIHLQARRRQRVDFTVAKGFGLGRIGGNI